VRRILATAIVTPLLVLGACSSSGEGAADIPDTIVPYEPPAESTPDESPRATEPPSDAPVEGQATSPAVAATLRRAPDVAADAQTVHVEIRTDVEVPELGPITIVATGGVDERQGHMSMEMDMAPMFAAVAEQSGESLPPEASEPMQVIVVGDDFYLHMPILESMTGPGWFHGRMSDMAGSAGAFTGGGTDPAAMLDMLRGIADDLRELGQDKVRGVPVEGYAGTISVDDALAEVPPDDRARLELQLDTVGGTDIDVEVWVDEDGLPRRLVLELGEALAATGLEGTMRMTMDLFDYGRPVEVTPPPPEETIPMSELGDLPG
jgi:hypothetical protein